MMMRTLLLALIVVPAVMGCSESAPTSRADAGPLVCETAADCDDGIYCNGQETCAPAALNASASGCVPAPVGPCANDDVCDERLRSCIADCPVTPDADGDGVIAIACGGTDCDDSDAERFPGNTEVCDDENKDEDCDETTFGFRDQDQDGWPDAACCNGENCGTDCDDAVAVIHPTSPELCDDLDNDCNGEVDDEVAFGELPIWYRDADGDGYGLQSAQRAVCTNALEGYSRLGGDCDDLDMMTNPDGTEVCDGLDNDCDPGTHACWIHTRTATPVYVPAVGFESGTSFERSCAGFGTGVAEIRFHLVDDVFSDVGVICGNYEVVAGFAGAALPVTAGVSTPASVSRIGRNGAILSVSTHDGQPAQGTVAEEIRCADVNGGTPTPTHLNVVYDEFTGLDGELQRMMWLWNVGCSDTRIQTPSRVFELGSTEYSETTGTDPGIQPTLACPGGHALVGVHGTSYEDDDLGTLVTSLGLICAPIFGVETL